jgi:hypothetical protein
MILLFLVAVYYLTESIIVVAAFTAVIIFVFVKDALFYNDKPLLYLDKEVDMQAYQTYLDQELPSRKQKYYPLYKAYALVYKGAFDEAQSTYDRFDQSIKVKEKNLYRIKTVIEMQLYYHRSNTEKLEALLSSVKASKLGSFELINSIKVYQLLLQENYEEAVDILMVIIPRLRSRVQIAEMEYYLAFCFYQLNRFDDANAITDFMLEKDYEVIYTELFRKLKDKNNI